MESRIVDIDEKKPSVEEHGADQKKKKAIIIRYRECMKNHAASIGGNATDGCGEFMASEEDSLKCSACKCHRNFHRKYFEETQDSDDTPSSSPYYHLPSQMMMHLPNNDVACGDDQHDQVVKPLLTHDLCLTNYNKSGCSDHDESDEKRVMMVKNKRHRTKFSEEQKGKMLRFADKVGWRMQKVDESMVQQFCEEAGIKRRVLKVWMHNNKNSFAKRRNRLISTS